MSHTTRAVTVTAAALLATGFSVGPVFADTVEETVPETADSPTGVAEVTQETDSLLPGVPELGDLIPGDPDPDPPEDPTPPPEDPPEEPGDPDPDPPEDPTPPPEDPPEDPTPPPEDPPEDPEVPEDPEPTPPPENDGEGDEQAPPAEDEGGDEGGEGDEGGDGQHSAAPAAGGDDQAGSGGQLPVTGADLSGFVLGGVLAAGIGAVTIYATRRGAPQAR
ncbi:hypothetical protein [Allosalinactinospora lopnorensis]|uniref:hypothetical protein n=1 Tax=Allosalinactinospora lopnorensis TaxID=1352348 RepID=UPI000623C3A9|nr:hypothetical protein [Allosalinactinospora lopnorensis]